jgi:ketosteroid isomerase-like protein
MAESTGLATTAPKLVPQRAYDAFNRGDIDALLAITCEDVEWHPAPEDPDSTPQYGHAGVRRFVEQWTDVLRELHVRQEELIEEGDCVVARMHYVGRGRGSGVPVEARVYQVFSFRDGLVARIDEFYDREQALEAARRA